MASYSTNLKDWGSAGAEYPDGYSYLEGEQPVDAWDNFITDNLIADVKDHLIPLTNSRVESDYGGVGGEPSSPEHPHIYYDTDNERAKHWDAGAGSWYTHLRRDGDTMQGVLNMGGYKIHDASGTLTLGGNVETESSLSVGADLSVSNGVTISGDLTANSDISAPNGTIYEQGNRVATRTWTNNNADVPNADYADEAGNADTLDGTHLSNITWSDVSMSRYTDSEARSAVNGSNVSVGYADDAGDADTVDGQHAGDISRSASDIHERAIVHDFVLN